MDRRAFLAAAAAMAGSAFLPGRAHAAPRARSLPRPTASLVTSWSRDPWSRGAYSALPPGVSPRVREVLAEALLGDRIALAGEYASDSAPATTTGAYRSGRTAAALVLDEVDPDRVIVIGAGMAGAAAAHALAAEGVDVMVLEARDRIGGRIRTDMSWGVPVEFGAGWIHGTTGNPITALARTRGLRLVTTDYDDVQIRDTVTGRESEAAALAEDRVAAMVSKIEEGNGPTSQSVGTWMRDHGWRPDRFGAWAAEVEITQEYGLGPQSLGVRAMQEGDDTDGPDALVGGGYARIPASLLEGLDVRMSSPVSSARATSREVRITLRDGSTLSADAAVVAVPVALLQRRAITLDPLPSTIATAISSLQTGDLEKVFLRYDDQWWDDASMFGVVGGGVPSAPTGSLASLRWTEFYSLTGLLGFPALVGFSGGAAAMTRPASAQGIVDEAVAALDAAFTPH